MRNFILYIIIVNTVLQRLRYDWLDGTPIDGLNTNMLVFKRIVGAISMYDVFNMLTFGTICTSFVGSVSIECHTSDAHLPHCIMDL